MIEFFRPTYTGNEESYVLDSMRNRKMAGDGHYSKLCQEWFEQHLGCSKALLTPSCTHALEMAALLIDVQPGDEIIMPSYTFVSTANAFVLRGAKIVFVDVKKDTMNIDEDLIEPAITEKTKAIVPVHYAGTSCDMDKVMAIAEKHGLYVIEDAAQCVMSRYKGKPLGAIGHIGAFSFHETKNYTSGGEGGLLIINDEQFAERAEIIREKGTNRKLFFRGMVDKYSWVDLGSSFLMSDLQAAYLWGQLEQIERINDERLSRWHYYNEKLSVLAKEGNLTLQVVSPDCEQNAHMFFIKTNDFDERTQLIRHLKDNDINAVFHYIPLHSSSAGVNFGHFNGEDRFTTSESEKLIRLPLYHGLTSQDQDKVIDAIIGFYAQ
ncbi:dTDP-4-amino-4,6-dideoxygalactose transaminase [Grimontia sp. NTOU-MAR1]|uniref:dTDP-4-amino-4,6-dideoxygalactose transaminase n=1 Tax=Grimontia sp. NTOU-MAR1 TaxID=3111011 RepID=UPI002DB5BCD3|nr:dTDP-4-amino-4,6-dideoxygalactose transaminase [Grimontia sp. NTOU-MAR1]WRV97509.1 dTDP-4-amino-4,6-dideoxygalactose transaminase [Grimontia sp. NTOU-MAR1]